MFLGLPVARAGDDRGPRVGAARRRRPEQRRRAAAGQRPPPPRRPRRGTRTRPGRPCRTPSTDSPSTGSSPTGTAPSRRWLREDRDGLRARQPARRSRWGRRRRTERPRGPLAAGLARLGHDRDRVHPAGRPTRPRPGADAVRRHGGQRRRPVPPSACRRTSCCPTSTTFAAGIAQDWAEHGRPDVVHAHFWMSGLAALAAGRRAGVPVAQTFHALGTVKRRHQGACDTSPPERLRLERGLAEEVDLVIATCADEVAELAAMGVPTGHGRRRAVRRRHRSTSRRATAARRHLPPRRGPRLLVVGRLVERKGVDVAVRALTRGAGRRPRRRRRTARGRAGPRRRGPPPAPRGRGRRRRGPRAPRRAGAARGHARGLPLGRPRPRRPLVRAVRHHAARGMPPAGGPSSGRQSAGCSTASRTAAPGCSSRPGTSRPSAAPSPRCSGIPRPPAGWGSERAGAPSSASTGTSWRAAPRSCSASWSAGAGTRTDRRAVRPRCPGSPSTPPSWPGGAGAPSRPRKSWSAAGARSSRAC